jgi:hypothetical protein
LVVIETVMDNLTVDGELNKHWKLQLTFHNSINNFLSDFPLCLVGLDGTLEGNNISGMGNASGALSNEQFMVMGGMMKERPPPPPHTQNLLHMAGNCL